MIILIKQKKSFLIISASYDVFWSSKYGQLIGYRIVMISMSYEIGDI